MPITRAGTGGEGGGKGEEGERKGRGWRMREYICVRATFHPRVQDEEKSLEHGVHTHARAHTHTHTHIHTLTHTHAHSQALTNTMGATK